jgi:transglutaminase-like putative cysteine protease
MHAWVSLWCGDTFGWIDLDPTNDILIGNDHIVLARGRDYADISPVAGIILGSREQDVDVQVDVVPRI